MKCLHLFSDWKWTGPAEPVLNLHELRHELRKHLKEARDCPVEIIMKDNHTLGKNPQNAVQWVRMALEEAKNL